MGNAEQNDRFAGEEGDTATAAAQTEAPVGAINALAGEIAVELEGVTYPLRASFQAIGEIETATGKTLYELMLLASEGRLRLADVGIIVAACIRAHARHDGNEALARMRPERAAELVYAEIGGVAQVTALQLLPLLQLAVTGGYTASGFPKPIPTKSPTNGVG
jgi:hypothetical protein